MTPNDFTEPYKNEKFNKTDIISSNKIEKSNNFNISGLSLSIIKFKK